MAAARLKTVSRTLGPTTDPNLQDVLTHRLNRFPNLTDSQIAALVLTLDPDVVEAVSDSVLAGMVSGVLPTLPLHPGQGLPLGLPGATADTRYAGGTMSGHPTSGDYLKGDFVTTGDGHIFICTASGTPGTWADAGITGGSYVPIPASFQAQSVLTSGATSGDPITYSTSSAVVARALGWVIITDPQWGAPTGNDWTVPIQNAVRSIDKWDNTAKAWTSGTRGGTIWFPGGVYGLSACIVLSARIKLKGDHGIGSGGFVTKFLALTGGDFTNTDAPTGNAGLAAGLPWMVRLSHLASGEWFHGGSVEEIEFDRGNEYVGGICGILAGELSFINHVHVINGGWQTRTVTATFNGTNVVTASGGAFDDILDFRARLTSSVFPTYTDFTASDAVTTTGSAVVSFPSGGLSVGLLGAAFNAGTAGFRGTAYVLSVNTAATPQTVTLSETLPPETTAGTGKTVTLGQPRDFRIDQIDSATQIQLPRPVPYTGTGSVTVYRGLPGIRLNGWSATGHLGNVNISSSPGPGLQMVGGVGNRIDLIDGDNNGGPLLDIVNANPSADPTTLVIGTLKGENNNYGDASSARLRRYGDHDPLIAIRNCGMINLQIEGGNAYASGDVGSNAVIRVQKSLTSATGSRGFPSISLGGLEAGNPYNQGWVWLFYDRDNSIGIAQGNVWTPSFGGRFYPDVSLMKDEVRLGGDLYLKSHPRFGSTSGRLTVDGSATFNGPVTFNGGTNSGTAPLDLSASTGTSTPTGTGVGDKIAFYGSGSYTGFGMQTGRIVAYGPAGPNGFSVRPFSGTGARSSGTDAVALLNNGTVLANSGVFPGNGTAPGSGLYSGSGAPAIAGLGGDFYFRRDTPTVTNQRIYACTVSGGAGVATWVGIL